MSRVVFDSNVYVSAFVFGGKPARLWRAMLEEEVHLVVSPAVLAEVARVLGDKFEVTPARVESLVRQVVRAADIVEPVNRLEVVGDEPDNRIVECAVEGHAQVIVTGDAHLLDIAEYRGIEIVTVTQALERFGIGEESE